MKRSILVVVSVVCVVAVLAIGVIVYDNNNNDVVTSKGDNKVVADVDRVSRANLVENNSNIDDKKDVVQENNSTESEKEAAEPVENEPVEDEKEATEPVENEPVEDEKEAEPVENEPVEDEKETIEPVENEEENDMRDKLKGLIGNGKSLNIGKIEGDFFGDIKKGAIKTHAYSDAFMDLMGNYIISSQEEYVHFLSLINDPLFAGNPDIASIDFEKYTLLVKAIQSGSGAYVYNVNGVIIGEKAMDIDVDVTGEGMTCDMARFYPYVIVEKEKLANDLYEGWKKPSEVESPNAAM